MEQKKILKTYILKTDLEEGIINAENSQLVEIDKDFFYSKITFPQRFSLYHKKEITYFTYNDIINILFIICLITLILLNFLCYDKFDTKILERLRTLISNLCFAFIASYIFYNVVTINKEKQRKIKAYAIICGVLDNIISSGKQVEKNIWKENYNLDKEGFKRACKEIDLTKMIENSDNTVSDILIFYGSTTIKSSIKILFNYMPFLESDILHQVIHIENSSFTRHCGVLNKIAKKNLSDFSGDIISFLDMIKELENLNSKLKIKYLKGYEKR